jgi:hypothetical protein
MHKRIVIRVVCCLSLLMLLVIGPACGRSESPSQPEASSPPGQWTHIEQEGRYSFRGQVAEDQDLSGIACISDRFGLIGADESRDVQVIEISPKDKTLRVRETVSLTPSGDEIDIEAIAAEGDSYYIIGSHGISKKEGIVQSNRYSLFRLGVDPATGKPTRPLSLERTSLSNILRADPILGEHFGQPLQLRGVNIEGLAVRNGRLFVGLRGPNLDGNAFVLEVGANDVFGGKAQPPYTLHKLQLGPGLGIREIVAARSGFLIIAGNSAAEPSEKYTQSVDYDQDREFSLVVWDGVGSEVHKIGPIPDVTGKAEAMTILEEAQDHVTVLMLFDGPRQGRPTVYRIY